MRRFVAMTAAVGVLVAAMAAPAAAHDDVDKTHLPIGHTSTSARKDALWSCQTNFGQGGASGTGPWFNSDGTTWDATKKTAVDGRVEWPNAKFTMKKQGDQLAFTTNDLPTDHTTGSFPIASSDPAHQYDRNPNSIHSQTITISVPLHPKVADSPSCIAGEVGILKSGVALFSAIDAGGRDAVAYEVQDSCQGHPQNTGEYHYHSASKCVLEKLDKGKGQSKQIGWAFDGFGIYGPRGADGKPLTNADLDECHGITSKVRFNGRVQRIYHYVATAEYPYTAGCFRGTSTVHGPTGGGGGGRQNGGPPQGMGPPPGRSPGA